MPHPNLGNHHLAGTDRRSLLALGRVLDAALRGRGWDAQPTVLVHTVAVDHDQFDLGVAEVDGHPLDHLLESEAPAHWAVLGVSQLGWARDLTGRNERRRVRLTALVSRAGTEATLVHHAGTDEVDESDTPMDGRIPDALRRALDVPTPAPTAPVTTFFASMWVTALAAAARSAAAPMRWEEAAALHPAVLASGERSGEPLEIGALRQADDLTWSALRWGAIEGRWRLPGLTPSLAAWFDDGSFSRWVQPDPGELKGLARSLTADASRRVTRALTVAGVR